MTDSIKNMIDDENNDTLRNQIEEDPACVICLDGTVYEGNEIIFCDKCNIAVHQFCYGIDDVPEGEWYCHVCEQNLDPNVTICELCSNTGGAYKPIDKQGKWIHSLCSFWIPEIFSVKVKGVPTLTLSSLDKKRYRLKCALCTSKGACIQCNYGRCATAAHPWCVLTKPQGFTRRVVKNEDGELLWEIFCKNHASAVNEPLKPKPKSKINDNIVYVQEEEEVFYEPNTKSRKSSEAVSSSSVSKSHHKHGFSEDVSSKLSMAHSLKFNLPPLAKETELETTNNGRMNGKHKKNSLIIDDDDDDEDNEDNEDNEDEKPNKNLNKGKSVKSTAKSETHASTSNTTFPLLNMSEWPGQSEGEAMDLAHFWNVVSTSFPSDHSPEWVDFMSSGLTEIMEQLHEMANNLEIGPLSTPTSKLQRNKIIDDLEDKMTLIGTDKERWSLFNIEKRGNFVANTQKRICEIKKSVDRMKSMSPDALLKLIDSTKALSSYITDNIDNSDQNKLAEISSSDITEGNIVSETVNNIAYDNVVSIDEKSLLISKVGEEKPVELFEGMKDGVASLTAVFDGIKRYAASFDIKLSTDPDLKLNSSKQSGWTSSTLGSIDDSHHQNIIHGKPASEFLIGPTEYQVSQDIESKSSSSSQLHIETKLSKFSKLSNDETIHLYNCEIVPKNEDDPLARFIRSNLVLLKQLSETTLNLLKILKQIDVKSIARKNQKMHQEWSEIESRYLKQRIWRKIASGIVKGIRDQKPDFNRLVEEQLPASWTIKVDGRPTPKSEEKLDEKDEQEDAVCMACFNGTSIDDNKILFCDGCNSSLHQVCYGVSEIPEGDFFCDRCRAVQSLATDDEVILTPQEIKESIKCCLCPQHHGAIKATTDGRWVHLCCAFWSKESVVVDLSEMSPIDVSRVPVQIPNDFIDSRSGRTSTSSSSKSKLSDILGYFIESEIMEPCVLCNIKGGHVIHCSGCQSNDPDIPCTFVCHPICAWFRGLYVETVLTDQSFQGLDREGIYPSGISYKFYCFDHRIGNGVDQSLITSQLTVSELRLEQQNIRQKYRISEEDLEYLPGKGGRKKKKRRSRPSGMRSDRATQQHRVKELAKDVYDDKRCACCLAPFHTSLFFDEPSILAGSSATLETPDPNEFNSLLQSYEGICLECKSIKLPELHKTDEKLDMEDEPSTNLNSNPTHSNHDVVESIEHINSEKTTKKVRIKEENDIAALDAHDKFPIPQTIIETWIKSNFDQRKVYEKYPSQVTCTKCKISVHLRCLYPSVQHLTYENVNLTDWTCNSCSFSESDPRCIFCPRRAGFYRFTRSGSWVHQYCALYSPGHSKIQVDGIVDVGVIPKESKKHICFICNRKEGVFSRCSNLGCTTFFHSLCGERSAKAYTFIRYGELAHFCNEHMPDGIEKNALGVWIDEPELSRFRYTLDRSRLILDTLCRRDKLKRMLCKLEGDIFQRRVQKIMDRAKGRKRNNSDDPENLEFPDSDSDGDDSDSENHDIPMTESRSSEMNKLGRPRKAKKLCWQDTPAGEDMTVTTKDDMIIQVRGSYVRNKEVKCPAQISISLAGIEVIKSDIEPSKEVSILKMKERIEKNVNILRRATKFFTSQKEADNFEREMVSMLKMFISLPDMKFLTEMDNLNLQLPSDRKVDVNYIHFLKPSRSDETKLKSSSSSSIVKGSKNLSNAVDIVDKSKRHSLTGNVHKDEKVFDASKKPGDKRLVLDNTSENILNTSSRRPESFHKKSNTDLENSNIEVEGQLNGSIVSPSKNRKLMITSERSQSKPRYSNYTVPHATYISVQAAEKELNFNPLFARLNQLFYQSQIDFSTVLALTGLDSHVEALVNMNKNDWIICDDAEKLIRLEARTMDILNELDSCEVPVNRVEGDVPDTVFAPRSSSRKKVKPELFSFSSSSSPSPSSNSERKSLSPSSSPNKPRRFLIGDFTEIPDATIPNYDSYVRRRLTITSLRNQVQHHRYKSMAAFSKDFYELLNNGIYVTQEDTKTLQDALELAKLFETAKVKSLTPDMESRRTAGQSGLEVHLVGSKAKKPRNSLHVSAGSTTSTVGGEITASCFKCNEEYDVTGWPNEIEIPDFKNRDSTWGWMCPSCIQLQGPSLVNTRAKVWWTDDKQFYCGTLRAYDHLSARHCILYDDNQWEFINLGVEPVLLSLAFETLASYNGTADTNTRRKSPRLR